MTITKDDTEQPAPVYTDESMSGPTLEELKDVGISISEGLKDFYHLERGDEL